MVRALQGHCPDSRRARHEFDGKVKIAKVNIDDNDSIAAEYGIRAIPTMLLFKGGKVAERVSA